MTLSADIKYKSNGQQGALKGDILHDAFKLARGG